MRRGSRCRASACSSVEAARRRRSMAMKQPKKVLVVGVGRFGAALIDELWESGCDLIVVDKDADAIDNIGARDVDVAVVTAGEAFEGVVLCVSVLAELGVKVIFARAANDRQASVLTRVGATRAIQVENEMGRRLAVQALNPVSSHLLDYATSFRVFPWKASAAYAGKTLADANFRRFELTAIGWFAGDPQK